jgi:hypothetical protein
MPFELLEVLLDHRWTRRLLLAAIATLLILFGDVAARNYQTGLGAVVVAFVLCELAERFIRRAS